MKMRHPQRIAVCTTAARKRIAASRDSSRSSSRSVLASRDISISKCPFHYPTPSGAISLPFGAFMLISCRNRRLITDSGRKLSKNPSIQPWDAL
jgi:hypothetical protein